MRTIESAAAAVLASLTEAPPLVLLVEMLLTEPLRLASSTFAVAFGGETYLGIGALGSVEMVDDSPGESKPLRFQLTGVSNDTLSIAMNEPVRNKSVSLRLGILDPSTHAVLDTPLDWSGTLDQMIIDIGPETSVVNVTAQHRGVTYGRVKAVRNTDVDQQRLYPGDTSRRFIVSQANHQDIWPAASYFRQ